MLCEAYKRNASGVVAVEHPRPCMPENGRASLPNPGLQQQVGTTLQSFKNVLSTFLCFSELFTTSVPGSTRGVFSI